MKSPFLAYSETIKSMWKEAGLTGEPLPIGHIYRLFAYKVNEETAFRIALDVLDGLSFDFATEVNIETDMILDED